MSQDPRNLMPGFDYAQMAALDTQAEMARAMSAAQMQAQQQTQFMLMQQTMQTQQMSPQMLQPNTMQSLVQQYAPVVSPLLQEPMYNDRYLGGGSYELERSAWRDFVQTGPMSNWKWVQSLHLGGRRPEYLSAAEYNYQLKRSAEMRWGKKGDWSDLGEWGDSAARVAIEAADIFTLGLADMAFGHKLDERQRAREFKDFVAKGRANTGTGHRGMSEEVAGQLSAMFEAHDNPRSWWRLLGMEKNLRPDVLLADVAKSEYASGGMKNIDLSDTRAVKKHVEDSKKLVNDYMGILNATADTVMDVLKQLTQFNLTRKGEREEALNAITKFKLSMGVSAEEAAAAYTHFRGTAMQAGSSHENAADSLMSQAYHLKIMKERGEIYSDPMQLTPQIHQIGLGWQQSPMGMIASAGGSVGSLMSYAGNLPGAGGSAINGIMMLKMGIRSFGDDNEAVRSMVKWLKQIRSDYGDTYALGMMMRLGLPPEIAKTIYDQVFKNIDIDRENAEGARAELSRMLGESQPGWLNSEVLDKMDKSDAALRGLQGDEVIYKGTGNIRTGMHFDLGKEYTLRDIVKRDKHDPDVIKKVFPLGTQNFLTTAKDLLEKLWKKEIKKEDIKDLYKIAKEFKEHGISFPDYDLITNTMMGDERSEALLLAQLNNRESGDLEKFGYYTHDHGKTQRKISKQLSSIINDAEPDFINPGEYSATKTKDFVKDIMHKLMDEREKVAAFSNKDLEEKTARDAKKDWENKRGDLVKYALAAGYKLEGNNYLAPIIEESLASFRNIRRALSPSGGDIDKLSGDDLAQITDQDMKRLPILKSLGLIDGNMSDFGSTTDDLKNNAKVLANTWAAVSGNIGTATMEAMKKDANEPAVAAAQTIGKALWTIAGRMDKDLGAYPEPPKPDSVSGASGSKAASTASNEPAQNDTKTALEKK